MVYDAAEAWLRANDPDYFKDKAIKKRKKRNQKKYVEGGNENRSSGPRQMRGVKRENLSGKIIEPSRRSRNRARGKR